MPKEDDSAKIYAILQEILRRSNAEVTRLRDLEQRLDSLENRVASIEEVSLERMEKSNEKFVDINATLRNMSDDILRMRNNLEKINRQINKFARKRDVKEIEKMFELLSPLKQEFVTRDELKEEVEEELRSRE